MNKVNTEVRLDPDFGTIVPPVESIFTVKVTSEGKDSYQFILLMPFVSNHEAEEELLHRAMFCLLDIEQEGYEISSIEKDEWTRVTKSTLVAAFDPEDLTRFIWITPPKHLRH